MHSKSEQLVTLQAVLKCPLFFELILLRSLKKPIYRNIVKFRWDYWCIRLRGGLALRVEMNKQVILKIELLIVTFCSS